MSATSEGNDVTDSPLTIIVHIDLPQTVIDEAAAMRDNHLHGGVDCDTCCGYPCVTAGPRVAWHTDSHDSYKYSLLMIVRNDHASRVESRGVVLPAPQPVGTLLLLSLRHEHRLIAAVRTRDLSWVAICWDMPRRPTTRECMANVAAFLKTAKVAKP